MFGWVWDWLREGANKDEARRLQRLARDIEEEAADSVLGAFDMTVAQLVMRLKTRAAVLQERRCRVDC